MGCPGCPALVRWAASPLWRIEMANRAQRRAQAAKARRAGYLHRLGTRSDSPPGVFHYMVQHDRDCAHWAGRPCSCCPDITRRAEGSDLVEVVGLDGSVT